MNRSLAELKERRKNGLYMHATKTKAIERTDSSKVHQQADKFLMDFQKLMKQLIRLQNPADPK